MGMHGIVDICMEWVMCAWNRGYTWNCGMHGIGHMAWNRAYSMESWNAWNLLMYEIMNMLEIIDMLEIVDMFEIVDMHEIVHMHEIDQMHGMCICMESWIYA